MARDRCREEMLEFARRLYGRGFNIIPLDAERRPIGRWSPRWVREATHTTARWRMPEAGGVKGNVKNGG